MAFWHRIGKSKLKVACTQFRACYIQLPHASSLISTPKPRPLEMPLPYWLFHDRPPSFYNSVRFFAAPIQFQTKLKKDEDHTDGPRLNEQIKSQYIRLVVDDGHSIVSRVEALDRARKFKLDLVEVDRNAKPPVCKIMDYHKETYKRQEVEKERAKSKSEVTLRKGECKEVRFSQKTEIKDLKMKADMVKKLMDKGYRVKCKATGGEEQDSLGSLSRLLALIEDVTVVESGPSMAKKDAYMIVRHVKYGPPKKSGSGGKKSQDAAHMHVEAQGGNMEPLTANSVEYDNQNSAKVLSNGTISPDHQTNAAPKSFFPSNSNNAEPENRYKIADHPSVNKVRPDAVTENRYRRAEPRNRFHQTPFNNTDAVRPMPSNLNQTRHVPADINVNPRMENTDQAVTPGTRNPMPSYGRSHPRSGYGNFSAQKGSETQGVKAGMHRNREGQPFSQKSQ